MFTNARSRHADFTRFRESFPEFIYHGYSYDDDGGSLSVAYHFEIPGLAEFRPIWRFDGLTCCTDGPTLQVIEELIFSLGLVEVISYWKATCSPLIRLPRSLSPKQERWWSKLFYNGLGEFRYLNRIEAEMDGFVSFSSQETRISLPTAAINTDPGSFLIPVGGGKDSAVSLELLSAGPYTCTPFMVNPIDASLATVSGVNGLRKALIVSRKLDPELLTLNRKGYLNGHTPFSALIAFSSCLTAALAGIGNIALSNESSANEDTLPGSGINHQYSKSFEFEIDFRSYISDYISGSLNYFSFLRPLSELSIAGIFSGFEHHLPVFRSCNVGSREGLWCGKCPKCLFAGIMLLPYLPYERIREIFGKDILSDMALIPVLEELCGLRETKPFECVGTISEVRIALAHFADTNKLPALLKPLRSELETWAEANPDIKETILEIHGPHALTGELLEILKNAQNAVSLI